MLFRLIHQRKLGVLARPEYKIFAENGAEVYLISADMRFSQNYVLSTPDRQYCALAECTVNNGQPAWRIWNGSECLGFLDVAKRAPFTYDLDGAGLHVTTSFEQLRSGVTVFTDNNNSEVGRLKFGTDQMWPSWNLDVVKPELTYTLLIMTFVMIWKFPA